MTLWESDLPRIGPHPALVRMVRPEIIVWRDPVCGHTGCERGARCGRTRFLEEIAGLGVVLIEGTSLAVLPLAWKAKPELARRLGVELLAD